MSKKQDKQSLAATQLASLLAAQSQQFSQYNPGQAAYGAYLLDSAQGMTEAQNQYIAEKKAKEEAKKKSLGGMLGTAGAVVAAPFTGGASLALAPGLSQVGSGIASGDMGAAASGLANAGAGAYKAWGTPTPPVGAAAAPTQDMNGMGVISPEAAGTAMPGMEFDPITGKWVPKKQTNMYDPTFGLF